MLAVAVEKVFAGDAFLINVVCNDRITPINRLIVYIAKLLLL